MARPILVVMALELEAQGRFTPDQVLFTGVGKVNASYRLTRRLLQERALGRTPLVVNFGTAGSRGHARGSVVACRRFIQRDMDVRELGFALGHTPFEDIPALLEFDPVFPDLPHAVCATADRFETLDHAPEWEVIDMEAYALAKVCRLEGVPFACAKFITDGADSNASNDWQTNLPHAAEAFSKLFERLHGDLDINSADLESGHTRARPPLP
ncbi:MAG: nucleosidase [Myxococcota bacterium]